MFNNVPEMFNYVDKLIELKDQYNEHKKKELNNLCEACNKNEIELEYKYKWYADEVKTKTGIKLVIYNHFFCKSCYKKIIETDQLERSEWMVDIDKEIWPELFNKENSETN